jgi:fused signal recognition particle receptor
MFSFIKNTLQKIYSQVTGKLQSLFSRSTMDEATLKELELLLISADTGVKTTRIIIENLKKQWQKGLIKEGDDLKKALEQELLTILSSAAYPGLAPRQALEDKSPKVYLLVGINGSGKTTFAGKLAHSMAQQNKKVLFVAADTFRAAAPEQLKQWASRTGASLIQGKEAQDPASVVFAGCEQFKAQGFDALIIDTAGRLQTKTNLMKELEKIRKIISRQLPDHTIRTLLTIDAMLGQNSFEQAMLFNESTQLDGVVLTKMDGTGKGGIVFAITQQLGIPVAYIAYGEQPEQLKIFNAQEYVHDLLNQ